MKIDSFCILFTALLAFCAHSVIAQDSFINFYNINPVPQSISLDRKDILELSNGDLVYSVYDEEICSIIKTDSKGDFIWGKELSGNHVFEPAQIIELDNSDILIVGRVRILSPFEEDMSMISFSNSGIVNWVKIINEPGLEGVITNVYGTMDNNVLITGVKDFSTPGGFSMADGFVGKVNSAGEIVQRLEISNETFISFSHIQELENGNVILFGQVNVGDLVVILLDSAFNEIWSKRIYLNDSVSPFENFLNSARDFEVIDNNILISTSVTNSSNEYYPVILSLDMDANVSYVKKYLIGGEPVGGNILVNQNNEAVFYGGYPKTNLFKMDISDGNVIWSKRLVEEQILLGIMSFTENYDYLFKLESQNTITVGKLDENLLSCLDFETVDFEESPVNIYIEAIDLIITNEDIDSEDFSSFQIENFDLTSVVFCEDTGITNNTKVKKDIPKIIVYPNPVKDIMYIKGLNNKETIHVYDVLGRKVQTLNANGEEVTSVKLENTYSGLLMISIMDDKQNVIYSGKIFKK